MPASLRLLRIGRDVKSKSFFSTHVMTETSTATITTQSSTPQSLSSATTALSSSTTSISSPNLSWKSHRQDHTAVAKCDIVTFNLLAPCYKRTFHAEGETRESSDEGQWRSRAKLALNFLKSKEFLHANIIALQEFWLDTDYVTMFQNGMEENGYALRFLRRTGTKTDAVAFFVKTNVFEILGSENVVLCSHGHRVALILWLKHRETGACLLVANTHLSFPHSVFEKMSQVRQMNTLTETMEKFAQRYHIRNASRIIVGDFNVEIKSPVCDHLRELGYVSCFETAPPVDKQHQQRQPPPPLQQPQPQQRMRSETNFNLFKMPAQYQKDSNPIISLTSSFNNSNNNNNSKIHTNIFSKRYESRYNGNNNNNNNSHSHNHKTEVVVNNNSGFVSHFNHQEEQVGVDHIFVLAGSQVDDVPPLTAPRSDVLIQDFFSSKIKSEKRYNKQQHHNSNHNNNSNNNSNNYHLNVYGSGGTMHAATTGTTTGTPNSVSSSSMMATTTTWRSLSSMANHDGSQQQQQQQHDSTLSTADNWTRVVGEEEYMDEQLSLTYNNNSNGSNSHYNDINNNNNNNNNSNTFRSVTLGNNNGNNNNDEEDDEDDDEDEEDSLHLNNHANFYYNSSINSNRLSRLLFNNNNSGNNTMSNDTVCLNPAVLLLVEKSLVLPTLLSFRSWPRLFQISDHRPVAATLVFARKKQQQQQQWQREQQQQQQQQVRESQQQQRCLDDEFSLPPSV